MKGGSWITLSLKTEEIEQSTYTDCQASAQLVLYVTKQNKTKQKKTVHGFDFLFLIIFLEQRANFLRKEDVIGLFLFL